MTGPIRVVIADDHPVVLRGLADLLRAEQDVLVVAECRDGDQALTAVETHRPDVVLLDIRMPRKDGFVVVETLKARQDPTRVILLATTLTDEEMLQASRLGVRGVLLKEMALPLLVQCVRKVHEGDIWIERRAVARALETLLRREAGTREVATKLTARQLQIARSVARGSSNQAVGLALSVSEGTVKTHLHAIYEKLGVRSRAELIVYCRERGIA